MKSMKKDWYKKVGQALQYGLIEHQEWILCHKCGNKTRLKLRKDTVLTDFPLFCPKCKEESLIDAEKFIVKEARR